MSVFDGLGPWNLMRLCTLADSGAKNHYYGQTGYAEDGSDGQVMVEIVKHYIKAFFIGSKYVEAVSMVPKPGYILEPNFINENGDVVDYIYVGAYEGIVQKISDETIQEDPDDTAPTYLTPSSDYVLCSIAGYKPKSNQTVGEFRTMAENRGSGWQLYDALVHNMIDRLFRLEYANLNCQAALGRGIVGISWTDLGQNASLDTGLTAATGNGSYGVTTDSIHAVRFRGIENLWGNIWKWADGLLVKDDGYYLAIGVPKNDAGSGYTRLAHTPLTNPAGGYVYGYADAVAQIPGYEWFFIPDSILGSETTHLCDYLYSHSKGATNVARVGGYWADAGAAGLRYWRLAHAAGSRARIVGARLLYKPN